jgi:hypothetical protein
MCVSISAHGQFFSLYQKPWNNQFYTILDPDNNGNFRVVNLRQYSNGPTKIRKNQILVYSQTGVLTDSIALYRNIFPVKAPLKIGSFYYWSCIYNDSLQNLTNQQKAYIMKTDLNFYPVAFSSVSYSMQADIPTNVVSVGNRFYLGNTAYSNNQCKIYKLNLSFQKIDSITFSVSPNYSTIEELSVSGDSIIVSAFNIISSDVVSKITIDTSLNILNNFPLNNLGTYTLGQCSGTYIMTPFHTKIVPLTATKIFVAGSSNVATSPVPLCDLQNGIINSILSFSNTVIINNVKKVPGKAVTYMDQTNWLDHKYNSIITVGNIGHNYQSNALLQGQATSIYVNKTDSTGNIIWERTYGGDMYYRPMSIKFTADTGCLIAGIRYDSVNTTYPDIAESFLLKLDKNGNNAFVGIAEHGKLNFNYHQCYPNPANENIYFDLPLQEKIEIKIYDAFGNDVLTLKEYQNLTGLEISGLPKGIYFYKIKTLYTSYSGKFIRG